MSQKKAIIIGAGPAGLTAAYELVQRTDIIPIVYEAGSDLGGLARTIEYKGNRIDIGGHRFFSKSQRVMKWWEQVLPLQANSEHRTVSISYHQKQVDVATNPAGPNPDQTDKVMLVRRRFSRIFYLRKFFKYPISLSVQTLTNLGVVRVCKILVSYVHARLFPVRPERSLEDFFINRFGRVLYRTFFKDYTEKVWGVPCSQIKAEWGAQRVKGLSVTATLKHAFKQLFARQRSIEQSSVETSLIERFLYPKLGPGQLWHEVAKTITERGGQIHLNQHAVAVECSGSRVTAMRTVNTRTGAQQTIVGDFFFSTMPVQELIRAMGNAVPSGIRELADGLVYRDFITVGLLLKRLKVGSRGNGSAFNLIPDNWIYVQEPDVKVGRIQIFNNWSPYLVRDKNTVWMGLEYFCNEGDELWKLSDEEMLEFARKELEKIGFIDAADFLDGTVVKVPKTYPAYWGTYDRFGEIRKFTDTFENLFLVGRNGMHKYNNQDHSMLTAMVAVDNIIAGVSRKDNIWSINTEEDYHEEK
jgi:protoporphyrinogen oxidase